MYKGFFRFLFGRGKDSEDKKIKSSKTKSAPAVKIKTKRKVIKKAVRRISTRSRKKLTKDLKKSDLNPIIEPREENNWESWQTFNPAAIYLDQEVHFLYRAIGEGGVSVLGYASSKDGIKIKERPSSLAYALRDDILIESEKNSDQFYKNYCSGGSSNGCEDPRIVEIDGTLYMTHTSFCNWSFVRVTLVSINKQDFLQKQWSKWNKSVFISPFGEVHKNWVIFPEKINGKFAILHSISPDILVDYFDSLDFDGKTFIKSCYCPKELKDGWESCYRGAGAPPIKTKHGWLLFYHATDKKDFSKYKIGVMLLDLKDPSKIICRAKEPVLEPDCFYENNGFKPGIVYSCGAVVIKNELFVYYGGADSVVCVATADLENFVETLIKEQTPKIKTKSKIKKRS